MNPHQIIKKIRKIESINLNHPEYVENYFISQSPFMQNEIITYYAEKCCGQIPNIYKKINIQKEYHIHINPDLQAYENYIILESIKNNSTYTHNYNQLSEKQKTKINQIYADQLMSSIKIDISEKFIENVNNIKIRNDLKHTAILALN